MQQGSREQHISSAEDTTTTEAIKRAGHAGPRRGAPGERRSQHTDMLPRLNGDGQSGKGGTRQFVLLREENMHLRSELARLTEEYSALQAQFDEQLAAVQHGHQLQVEKYQSHLRDMLEEHRQLQAEKEQLERRYQELYHNFQNAIEEEAHKMIAEAAGTIILRPEHTPALLNDVKKTVELQLRQEGDQHAAETLYLIREAQRKAQRLEQELAQERQQIANERQSLLNMQHSIREQADLRYKTLETRLKARWTLTLVVMSTLLILLLPLLQSLFYFTFKFPLQVSLYTPILICILLATLFARLRVTFGQYYQSAPRKVRK